MTLHVALVRWHQLSMHLIGYVELQYFAFYQA